MVKIIHRLLVVELLVVENKTLAIAVVVVFGTNTTASAIASVFSTM